MKVVQVLSSLFYDSAGPSYSVPGLARGLWENGVDVEIYTRDPKPKREFPYPVKTFPSTLKRLTRLGCSDGLKRGLRKIAQEADVIHSNGLWMMPCVYPAWAVRGTRCRLVVAPRGALAKWTIRKNRWIKCLFGWAFQYSALRRVDMFHATSVKEYEEIRAAGYRQPVVILPIGMDLPVVERPARKAGDMRKIVFFGRLHSVKKVDDLIMAWAGVCDRMPDWCVEIAGPDFGVRRQLEELVASHQIPRVKFVGEIKGQDKYEFLASADLYVLPSLTENFGITIAEALACGTPVIASQGTPWRGLVDNQCGWWVENSPEAIAKAIQEAAVMPRTELMQMGQRGRRWIERDFSWAGVGLKMKSAYEWLLRGGAKPEWVRED